MSRYDKKLAQALQEQINFIGITENAVIPKEKENYRPRTLVDQTLEYIDPTPNIFTLFIQFNEKYFWNKLLPVQVKWSPRMTSCAGVCSFHPRSKECIISLSTPLLKLRPRKDLIETLLHEMIHAYLFLTNNNRDRDGHGPVFQSHMKRINNEAGTNITIYHDFHEEVKLYQQHWWRCNGPCQKKAPYFGMVRRAMNRAPGPSDFWWNQHKLTCGGQYIKVKEPEKPEPKKKSNKSRTSTSTAGKPSDNNSLLQWVKKNDNNTGNAKGKSPFKLSNLPQITSGSKKNLVPNVQTDLKKLGNGTNNVYGWGVGGPNSSSSSSSTSSNKNFSNNTLGNRNPHFSGSGTLGGSGTGRSVLLDKFLKPTTDSPSKNTVASKNKSSTPNNLIKTSSPTTSLKNSNVSNYSENPKVNKVNCPSCNKPVDESKINEHLDMCLLSPNEPEITPSTSSKKRKSENDHSVPSKIFKNENTSDSVKVECPLCDKKIAIDNFNDHLDNCAQNDFKEKPNDNNSDVISLDDSDSSSVNLHDSPHVCLICDKKLKPNETLNSHLEECVSSVFNDSNAGDDNIDGNTVTTSETDEQVVLDELPCPVCMQLVKVSLMNDHLDTCLS